MARGKAPKILLYGMMALSARFSKNAAFHGTDPRLRGKTYAKACANLLDWNQVSLTTIQACVLLGAIAVTEGNSASENIYYAVACRIAQLLDLPNCKMESRVEQEINIRTWWSLCMIDVWSSTGVRLPRLLPPKENVSLPIDEVVFLGMSRDRGFDETIQTSRNSSLLAEMVRLNYILQQINDFNIRVAESKLDSVAIQGDLEDLSSQLDRWLDELPDHIRDTRENLERFSALGLGRVFVAIYLGYYHFGQMLFYRFLHEDSQSTSLRTRHYANKCKEHAGRLCDIVYASETVPNCDAKYNMVGHVLVIASTVQIHSLLFESNDTNVALAKERLEKNFCILTQLCAVWPTLDVCMDRLMAFHKACRESADTSFCMDQWMVRFLVEFASPVTDKTSHASDGSQWSLAELGITSD
ncbi:hypothetical protein PENSUB_10079 [Penicillium subrubescens]|uniref:Xylanolytic transcriptional activator regulatory domain-containing protein n=2 Tax=Penicillium subrubescens TaxID=1316194 RepID=A0A1Q5TAM5_9EURO|nr:hypothetical protein PENSUB_10079 [Penicillium subrubescens]